MKTREQLSKELTDAAKKGDLKAMRVALADGADINAIAKPYYGTALYVAAFNGQLEAVKLLIEHGANLEIASISDPNNNVNETTPLSMAIGSPHTAIADLLISRGANINTTRNDGASPLIRAAEQGLTSILQKLIDRGADITHVTKINRHALLYASGNGHIRCVDLIVNTLIAKFENAPEDLLAFLKKTNALRDSLIHAKNGFVFYYLFKLIAVLMQKLDAARHEDINDLLPKPEEIKYKEFRKEIISFFKTLPVSQRNDLAHNVQFLRRSPFYILAGCDPAFSAEVFKIEQSSHAEIERLKEFKDANPQAALFNAAASGDIDAAEICIKSGSAKVNKTDGWNSGLPLYVAAENGRAEMVEFLLKNGAEPFVPLSGNKSAAHLAAENGHANVIHVLAKLTAQDKYREVLSCQLRDHGNSSPLMLAIRNDKPEAAIALIKCKALSPYWSHPRGYSELYYAVYYKQTAVLDAMVDEMITWPPEDLLKSLLNNSCFYDSYVYASRKNHDALAPLMRVLDHLHNHGLLNDKKTYLDKLIPEDMFCMTREFKTILLKRACYLPPAQELALLNRILNPEDIYGVIARIARGLEYCNVTNEDSFLRYVSNRMYDLKRSIDAAAKKLKGEFCDAVDKGDLEAVSVCIKKGVNVNAMDESNSLQFAIIKAAHKGNLAMVELLHKNGANINSITTVDYLITALSTACSQGHAAVVEFLLDKGAHVNQIREADGATPLMIAINGGKTEIIKTMLNANPYLNVWTRKKKSLLQIAAAKSDGVALELLIDHIIAKNDIDLIERILRDDNNFKNCFTIAPSEKTRKVLSKMVNHLVAIGMSTYVIKDMLPEGYDIPEKAAAQPVAAPEVVAVAVPAEVAVAVPSQPEVVAASVTQVVVEEPPVGTYPVLPVMNTVYSPDLQTIIDAGAKQREQAEALKVEAVVEAVPAPAVSTYENPFAEEMRMEEEKNMRIAESFATLFSVKKDAALAIPLDISFEPVKNHNPFDALITSSAAPAVEKQPINPFAIPADVTETDLNAALDDHTQDLLTDDAAIRKIFNLPPAEKTAAAIFFPPVKKPAAMQQKRERIAVQAGQPQ